jgi:hypothetical protein
MSRFILIVQERRDALLERRPKISRFCRPPIRIVQIGDRSDGIAEAAVWGP